MRALLANVARRSAVGSSDAAEAATQRKPPRSGSRHAAGGRCAGNPPLLPTKLGFLPGKLAREQPSTKNQEPSTKNQEPRTKN
ncbi:MAG: hypothetical protein R3C09_14810 [Pirellulaceae bacterium]